MTDQAGGTVTEAQAITLTIPGGPVYELSPNARVHHMAKHKATKAAQWTAYNAIYGTPYVPGPVELDWLIRLDKGRKRMDWDNAIATLKPAMDSLVMAGVILDDNTDVVTRIGLRQELWSAHRVNGGELMITITPARDGSSG